MYVDCEPAIIHCRRASWRVFEHVNVHACVCVCVSLESCSGDWK